MAQPENQQRKVLAWSAAFAVALVSAVFVASIAKGNLFLWMIGTSVLLPIVGAFFVIRVIVGWVAFFRPERPHETRTVPAMFWRDKWLMDRIRLSQPLACLTVGATLTFVKLAMLVALALAALFVFLRIMSLGQAISVLVVGSLSCLCYQLLGGTFLLVRQMRFWRGESQS